MRTEFPEVFALSIERKLELLGDLWDSIAESPEKVPIPNWQIEEVVRRKQEYEKDPSIGISWEEARQRILRKHEES